MMHQNPDLLTKIDAVIKGELEEALYELNKGFKIENMGRLELMADKPYTAISKTSVSYDRRPLGNGTVSTVLFMPGDGTGSTKDFQHPGILPEWTPRLKEGYAELFIPIATIDGDNCIRGATSLDLVTLNPQRYDSQSHPLQKYAHLTLSSEEWRNAIAHGNNNSRKYAFTFDREEGFGNPHATIFYPDIIEGMPNQKIIQVGAFLAFPEKNEALDEIIEIIANQPPSH
ncbi:MAG TPA: hypothetical protein VJK03_03465 [Candidatus Nanoarchaeia archaeon]|nr:hypothetical protein [Candidatus Nanoarchaeia archaeon]